MSDPDAAGSDRPQYGEYASPEEQRARIRQPAYPPEPVQPAAPAAPRTPAPAAPVSRRRPLDLVFTVGLLAYGLVTVVTAVPRLLDPASYIHEILSVTGVDADLADPASARWYGVAAAVIMVVLWLAAAVWSWLRLRRGRIAFWVPLAAGVIANVATTALLMVPMLSDPGVAAAIRTTFGGA